MCKDIWEQSPAQRNYEFYCFMCRILNKDSTTYKPLKEAIKRLEKEIGHELPNKGN